MSKKVCVFLFCLTLCLSACSTNNSANMIKSMGGVDVSECVIVREYDNRSAHGDGIQVIEYDCSEKYEQIKMEIEQWNRLPLTENLGLIMYGGEKDNTYYTYNLADENKIPEIENGFYYFVDRYNQAQILYNDSELLSRYSFNFTLLLYDSDTQKLYYIEYDT